MIKILFFIPNLSEGGAEKVLTNLVSSMDRSRYDITVQTVQTYDPSRYLPGDVHYKSVNHFHNPFLKKMFGYWLRLCEAFGIAHRLYVRGDYDLEVAFLETEATKMIAQSSVHKSGKIAWVHCDLSRKEGIREAVEKLRGQYQKFDRIVCVSADVERGFQTLFGTDFPTTVLHTVIDQEEILQKSGEEVSLEKKPGEIQLLAVGRLTQQKNFELLIRSCSLLKQAGYRFHLNILGEGPERGNLEELIRKLKLTDTVTLRGFIPNPYPWMRQSDLIVCSSRYEGISTVVQEAMILKKVTVTVPCTGMKELLGDSEYGILAEDSEEGLYQALKTCLDYPEKVNEIEKHLEEYRKMFFKEESTARTAELFEELLKEKKDLAESIN